MPHGKRAERIGKRLIGAGLYPGTDIQNGKIICEEHGTSFHRQVLKSAKGEKEVWQCRVYRNRGRAACSAPQLRTSELDQVMAQIFDQLAQNKQGIIDTVTGVIQSVPGDHDYERDILHIRKALLKWLKNFYRRFFSQQFKRSCVPDGPKVGSVSLSPRGPTERRSLFVGRGGTAK